MFHPQKEIPTIKLWVCRTLQRVLSYFWKYGTSTLGPYVLQWKMIANLAISCLCKSNWACSATVVIDLSCLINNAPRSYYWHVCHYTNPPHAEPMKWMAWCCHNRVAYLCHLRGGICPMLGPWEHFDGSRWLVMLFHFQQCPWGIGSAWTERVKQGEVGEFTQRWKKTASAVEYPWFALGGPFLSSFVWISLKGPLTL